MRAIAVLVLLSVIGECVRGTCVLEGYDLSPLESVGTFATKAQTCEGGYDCTYYINPCGHIGGSLVSTSCNTLNLVDCAVCQGSQEEANQYNTKGYWIASAKDATWVTSQDSLWLTLGAGTGSARGPSSCYSTSYATLQGVCKWSAMGALDSSSISFTGTDWASCKYNFQVAHASFCANYTSRPILGMSRNAFWGLLIASSIVCGCACLICLAERVFGCSQRGARRSDAASDATSSAPDENGDYAAVALDSRETSSPFGSAPTTSGSYPYPNRPIVTGRVVGEPVVAEANTFDPFAGALRAREKEMEARQSAAYLNDPFADALAAASQGRTQESSEAPLLRERADGLETGEADEVKSVSATTIYSTTTASTDQEKRSVVSATATPPASVPIVTRLPAPPTGAVIVPPRTGPRGARI